MTRVHIHARDISLFDAVGNFCRQLAQFLDGAGFSPMLWAENYAQAGAFNVQHRDGFLASLGPEDVIFFNHSIFDPILVNVLALPHRKLLYFHNVTPPELIDAADIQTVENCRKGQEQIRLFGGFDSILANSTATCDAVRTLLGERMPAARVAPPVIGFDRFMSPSQQATSAPMALLCIGRLVPHKRVDKMVSVFAALQDALAEPRWQQWSQLELHFVGGPSEGPYVEELKYRAGRVSDRIRFFHGISDAELATRYQNALACLSLSLHEGFCVPALDALLFDKPFLCTPMPPVQELLGAAALALPEEPEAAAAELLRFLSDPQALKDHAANRAARRTDWQEMASGRAILDALEEVRSR